ncbi:MAG TPA: tRNA 2-thiouridine(34) synthase MnmA, partial [Campylobacterales bacterium]|nr:tRNA 2-thiouridine(34) synthase MnmA [Campylobacterales bacterium]
FAKNIPVLQDIGEQKESSEICFVENEYTEILERHMNIDQAGETINAKGEVVGTHKGYMHYTIGKRRGFTVDGAHDPHFVLAIDAEKNQIVVGKREELAKDSFGIKKINLFETFDGEFSATVKVRYRTQDIPCHVTLDGNLGSVQLEESVYGLAYEQVAVFYDGNRVIGSGVIC